MKHILVRILMATYLIECKLARGQYCDHLFPAPYHFVPTQRAYLQMITDAHVSPFIQQNRISSV